MREKLNYVWGAGLIACFCAPSFAAETGVDLALRVRGMSSPVAIGKEAGYTLVVENRGAEDVSRIILTDGVAPGLRIVSVTPSQGSCTRVERLICCNLGPLAAGHSAELKVTVTGQAEGMHRNGASIYSPSDSNHHNNKIVTIINVLAASQ